MQIRYSIQIQIPTIMSLLSMFNTVRYEQKYKQLYRTRKYVPKKFVIYR